MKSKKIALIIIAAFTSLSLFAGCSSATKSAESTMMAREPAYEGEYYDEADYIRDYNQFKKECAK